LDWNSKISGNYDLPLKISFSGTMALYNGVRRQRTYLFRNLPQSGTVTLRLEPYGGISAPTRTLLSLRFSRNLSVGPYGQRLNLGLDILNALNSNIRYDPAHAVTTAAGVSAAIQIHRRRMTVRGNIAKRLKKIGPTVSALRQASHSGTPTRTGK
jgi:hypothetical protein